MTGARGTQKCGASPPGEGASLRDPAAAISPLPRVVWYFVALALLALPLFAHGCHGDDIDHEPLLVPLRLNSEDR